ncbi:MAG TPA: ABC transporter permease [Spirochaetia bacterium]|nr:ABC transporter permease [Spirochaetia bacterium]
MRIALPLLGLFALNLFVTILHWWQPVWLAVVFADFALIVLLAERVGLKVPARRTRLYERSLAVGFPVLILGAWELLVRGGILNPDWFPPPSHIASALWDLITKFDTISNSSLLGRPWLLPEALTAKDHLTLGSLLKESHLYVTLMRVFVGFFIGAIPGVFVGVAMGMSRVIRSMIDATLSAFYVLPKIAIFPIMMLVFPDPFGEGPKIAVVALSVFFVVTINTMVGVRDIDPVLLEAGRNYGAKGFRLFRHVILPGALPVVFAGLRLALGTALIVIIAVEFVRAQHGVGYLTFYYWQILAPEKMYAALVVVMLLGVLLTWLLRWVELLVMPWRRDERTRSKRVEGV